MLFSYKWLQNYISGKFPNSEKLADLLSMHSFETEVAEKIGNDFVLNVDVPANRSRDCFCHLGLVREIGAILDRKIKNLEKEKLVFKKGGLKPIKIKIQCPSLVPHYSAMVIEEIKVTESPQWLQNRLKTIGIRSINNIVDLTNFVMAEIGQPLHAFDYDKIKEQTMILRKAKKGERVITLDGIKRKLDEEMIVIEDKKRLIDLVGIMGGKLSEVDSKTKNIILQAANFDRRSIYLTSKKLKHSTEASNIYSRGTDPNLTIPALERAYFLLKKLSGGKLLQIIDIYPKKILPQKIKLNLDYLESLLGVRIAEKEIIKILKSLGFEIKKQKTENKKEFFVIIPTFRGDINIPEDLIEEIGRIYGYEKIKSVFPTISLMPPKKNFEIFWENIIKNSLKEAGLTEVYNYSFVSEKDAEIFDKNNLIKLKNPISAEFQYLTPSLIPNLFKNIQKNQKLQLSANEIRIFEIGKIFIKKEGAGKQVPHGASKEHSEKKMLTGIIAKKEIKNPEEGFYELKGIIDSLLNGLGISNVWYDEFQPTPEDSKIKIWNLKRCAEIKTDNEEIGFLGEINPGLYQELDNSGRISVFDLDFEKLIKLASEEHEYRPISPYPAAIRDLAILVPLDTKVEDVLNIIEIIGKELVRDVDLFDIYEGEELPEGKKNLAFHIIYQTENRTLTSEEINKIQEEIIKTLEKSPEWEVRK